MKLINKNVDISKYTYKNNIEKRKSINNNIDFIRSQPISQGRAAVSFKGLTSLLYSETKVVNNYKKLLKIASKDLGEVGDDLFNDLLERGAKGKKFIEVDGGIKFQEDNMLKSIIDSVAFPVVKLPFLLVDFFLDVSKKVPGLKIPAKRLYDSGFLSKIRESSKLNDDVNVLKGIIQNTEQLVEKSGISIHELEKASKNPKSISDGLFKTSNKFFDPSTGNYNTVHERTLNRLVTGLIPAAFLANDAYNLSVLCGDNEKTSSKEKKARYKQEVSRVTTNAYLQLITLGSLTSLVNKSPIASATISAITVLASETISRMANGKPVTFISSERAKEINKKNSLENGNKEQDKSSTVKNDKIESKSLPHNEDEIKAKATGKPLLNFGKDGSAKIADSKKSDSKKSVITFNSLMKTIGVLAASGMVLSFLRNSSYSKNVFKNIYRKLGPNIRKSIRKFRKFTKSAPYKKLVTKDFEISTSDFNNAMKKLELSKYDSLANKYSEIVGDQLDKSSIKLFNKKMKPIRVDTKFKPMLDMLIQPFQFVWGAIKLPFKITKNILNIPASSIRVKEQKYKDALLELAKKPNDVDVIAKAKKLSPISEVEEKIIKLSESVFGESSEKKSKSTQQIFASSIGQLIKKAKEVDEGKISQKEFSDFVKSSVLRSFNSTNQSKYSNTDLATVTKIASSTVTSTFLVADNYNMVMLKSNGENKEDAKQKAQERVVQRVSALFYQTLFMNWFNSTFEKLYHSALTGMMAVSGVNTVATEVFTRKSIGMPLGAKSYDELAEIDNQNLNRKGFLGSYFRFMSLLTGKKPLVKKQSVQGAEKKVVSDVDAFALLKKQDKKVATTDLLAIYGSKNK